MEDGFGSQGGSMNGDSHDGNVQWTMKNVQRRISLFLRGSDLPELSTNADGGKTHGDCKTQKQKERRGPDVLIDIRPAEAKRTAGIAMIYPRLQARRRARSSYRKVPGDSGMEEDWGIGRDRSSRLFTRFRSPRAESPCDCDASSPHATSQARAREWHWPPRTLRRHSVFPSSGLRRPSSLFQ